MVSMVELPKDLRPCETCGRAPDTAKRSAWLAGCPDDHTVREWFNVLWLALDVVHLWPDRTYAAIRIEHHVADDDLILRWLDSVHAATVPRRQYEPGQEVIFDCPTPEYTPNPATGDVTVTWRLPTVEGT